MSTITDMHSKHTRYFSSRYRLAAAFTLLMFLTYGCAGTKPPPHIPGHANPYKINGEWYQPIPHADDFKERGIASWYGTKFHGRKTANGEIYNMYGMTAAHKTLPLGTYVRVRNLNNKKQIDVRINDRGPFVRGRIIDLSYAAAKKIGIVGPGVARVEITAIGSAMPRGSRTGSRVSTARVDLNKGDFSFQVGAFRNRENAEKQRKRLSRKYRNVRVERFSDAEGIIYKVRVGKFSSLNQARNQEKVLIEDGYTNVFIIAD